MTDYDISVVIVAWNSAESLRESLGALRQSAAASDAQVELIVVDNASTDDSRAVASEAGAVVVENPLNAGYVVAASQGIALARGTWVMLANPDLTVSEGFVGAMLEAARGASDDVACLVPDIRYAANPGVVNSRGIEVDETGVPAESHAGSRAAALPRPGDVFGPSTSGCLIRRSALAAVGGLEPLYFAYLEDVDVGWRLRKHGFRAVVVPDAVALHEGSASIGEGSWLKAFLVARNRRVLFRLHGPAAVRARALRTVTEVGHATVQAVSGSGTASVRGRAAALQTRRYTRFLRLSERMTRGRNDAAVALSPRPSFHDALRRKRAASSLMSRGGEAATSAASGSGANGGGGPRVAVRSRVARDGRLSILVDATNLKPGQGGIRTYSIGLVQALAAREELALIVATSVDEVADLGPLELVKVSPRTRGITARAAWRERNFASLARSLGVEATLTPVPELPLTKLPLPSVVVVHDVGPLVAPAFYSVPKRLRYQMSLPRTCRLATTVVCVSHSTLVDLHAATGIDVERCEVIGEGPQLLGEPSERSPVGAPYFLYVGSLDARKNVDTLLDAMTEASFPETLVIAGPTETRTPAAFERRVDALGLGHRVRHLGFVGSQDLAALYRDASALVLPSLYEGFGLPVLEAMALGTPVAASEIPPVREVAGDAALYVSRPLDPSSWQGTLARLSADRALREDLSRRGLDAAARHTWSAVAERFAEVLWRVAGRLEAATTAQGLRQGRLS